MKIIECYRVVLPPEQTGQHTIEVGLFIDKADALTISKRYTFANLHFHTINIFENVYEFDSKKKKDAYQAALAKLTAEEKEILRL